VSLLKSSSEVSRTAFNRWADFYDSSRIINKATEGWDDFLIDLSLPEPILDMGCATGRLLRKFDYENYEELYGIDISESCLNLARKNSPDSKIKLTQGFLERLPFKDRSFSSAILSGVLHHLEKPPDALNEIYRILKKPGIFVICEPRFVWGLRHLVNLVTAIYPVQGDRRFYTWRKIAALAEKAGFTKKALFRSAFSYILIFEKC
jgi:ubiquinone/menaquinone biosynthesis C-methylase UbiE